MELLTDPHAWIAFITLSALEIVLGIDNIIFISILVSRLPPERRETARITGLALAMITRIALLFSIVWLTRLTQPWFSILGQEFSGRDIILLLGGLFLLAKSVTEIHGTLEGEGEERHTRVFANFTAIVVQIAVIDIVFSLDSVFTAVGLAKPDRKIYEHLARTLGLAPAHYAPPGQRDARAAKIEFVRHMGGQRVGRVDDADLQ